MGHLWLLPRLQGSLGALHGALRQPGLCVARRGDGAESWVLAEDLLLLAGRRAKVRGMSNEDDGLQGESGFRHGLGRFIEVDFEELL